MNIARLLGTVVLLASTSILGSGCYAEAGPPVYAAEYEPQVYEGNVVYYDAVGHPFYYSGSNVVWISPASPRYAPLVTHWHAHAPAYHRWYTARGYHRR
jgi:hypothetical protein